MKLIKALVFHKRIWPKANSFRYSCNYISIKFPFEEKEKSRFFGLNKFNIFSVYEKDYANGHSNLLNWCAEVVNDKKQDCKINNIELITMPRVLGYAFNPVSFIFCNKDEKHICTILKVNNTFSEDHYYIKFVNHELRKSEQNYYIEKLFHVSPFLPREGYYKIRFDNQYDFIRFDIDYFDNNEKNILVTSINGEKLKIKNSLWVLNNFFSSSFLIFRVILLIHFQATKLFFKKVRFYKKPKQNINRIT